MQKTIDRTEEESYIRLWFTRPAALHEIEQFDVWITTNPLPTKLGAIDKRVEGPDQVSLIRQCNPFAYAFWDNMLVFKSRNIYIALGLHFG